MSRFYTERHEWIDVEGDIGTVGITDYAQDLLGDIVLVSLPKSGAMLRRGGNAAVVEAMEATSDIYAPVDGIVTDGNMAISTNPALVNLDPEGNGWFFRMILSNFSQLDGCMNAQVYKAFCGRF